MKTRNIIFIIVFSCILLYSTYKIGEDKSCNKSYYDGLERGYVAALDTVNKLLVKHAHMDSTVAVFYIINPDTCRYYLSPKTIKK